ncbi:ferritin-like domain-containing protein [Verrucomicrobium sp. BvORR106]|uniref:ferritin-like domain-containing protein n=1 Tax=Verrucomicrobium sp. BvORR106 TaxID=1403819 RepID=UPI00068CDDB9|nr:ferritin-like domain-containing protein [Verrucomicrobium sp. BvORR106]
MTPIQISRPFFNLKDLLCEQLRDLHDAEKQYGSQLPEMVAKATSSHLKDKLSEISDRVLSTAEEVAHACRILEVSAEGVTCEAMKGLVREAKDTSSDWGDSATLDASLISNAQRIAHYEIAGFGTARAFARCLKLGEVAEILQHLLEQAFQDDKDLSYIANGGWFTPGINHEAADPAFKPTPTPGIGAPSTPSSRMDVPS